MLVTLIIIYLLGIPAFMAYYDKRDWVLSLAVLWGGVCWPIAFPCFLMWKLGEFMSEIY